MSFDVFLQRFEKGEIADVPRQPVRDVLAATSNGGPDEYGFYNVTFPDGVDVEFSAKELESTQRFTGCVFHIHSFGNDLLKFILEVARAGGMVIIPAMEGNTLILISETQEADLPRDLQHEFRSVVVNSPGELGAVLQRGFNGWSAYRDHVLRQSTKGNET